MMRNRPTPIGHDVRMIRLLIRIGIALLGNALGLWVASLVLDDMSISGTAFLIAVAIFTVLTAVLQPLITKVASEKAPALQGASTLITTFLALLVTELISDGLTIDGLSTWLFATIIVWLFTLVAAWLLPILLIKEARDDKR